MTPTSSTSAKTALAGAAASPTELIADELVRVEQRIRELARSQESTLTEIGADLIASGGKRVRPALTLLVFRACGGGDPSDAIDVGAALELIHSATLLHDDILDGGQTRRGRPSPLARHGLALTLVTGDFLFSKAFGVAGRFDAMVVGWAMDACVSLCEGEILQQRFRRNLAVRVEDYLEIAARKTASLFSKAARIGAHFAGASADLVDAMERVGFGIGIAFQMIDDLLDVVGPAELIGKPVGTDLREGTPALPIVLGLERLPDLARTFASAEPDRDEIAAALASLRSSTVLAEVRQMANARIRTAVEDLELLPASRYRDALIDLAGELRLRTA